MGIMYATVRRLYLQGKIDEFGLDNAVKRSWITQEEKATIMAEKG
nr:MAG TPA: hypothetical protein [Caudoviricetes sp.]